MRHKGVEKSIALDARAPAVHRLGDTSRVSEVYADKSGTILDPHSGKVRGRASKIRTVRVPTKQWELRIPRYTSGFLTGIAQAGGTCRHTAFFGRFLELLKGPDGFRMDTD